MKITVYECDKCHKRFNDVEAMALDMFGLADICEKCFKKASSLFINWLDGTEAEPVETKAEEKPEELAEEKAEEPKTDQFERLVIKPKKKKIDWNKACALKEAGWSHRLIADELGIDSGTLNSGTFYKRYAEYKEGKRF